MPGKEEISSFDLTIRFTGDAVQKGEMDAQNLGNALITTSKLIKSTNKVIGNKAKIDVIFTGANKGSFELCLEIISNFAEQFSLFSVEDNIQFLLDSLFGKEKGLIDSINSSEGEYPNENEKVSNEILELYENRAIRKALRNFIRASFARKGVEKLYFSRRGYEDIEVKKEDVKNFDDKMNDDEPKFRNAILEIISLSFKEKNKWLVKEENGEPFYVEIQAPVFLKDINNNEKFSKNDYLLCEIKKEKKFNHKKGIIIEKNIITKVHQHIPAEKQLDIEE